MLDFALYLAQFSEFQQPVKAITMKESIKLKFVPNAAVKLIAALLSVKKVLSFYLHLSPDAGQFLPLKKSARLFFVLSFFLFLSACSREAESLRLSVLEKEVAQLQARVLVAEESFGAPSAINVSVEELVLEVLSQGFSQVLVASGSVVATGVDLPDLAQVELAYQVVFPHAAENKVSTVNVFLVQGKGVLSLTIDLPVVENNPESIQLQFTPRFWYPVYPAVFQK